MYGNNSKTLSWRYYIGGEDNAHNEEETAYTKAARTQFAHRWHAELTVGTHNLYLIHSFIACKCNNNLLQANNFKLRTFRPRRLEGGCNHLRNGEMRVSFRVETQPPHGGKEEKPVSFDPTKAFYRPSFLRGGTIVKLFLNHR